MKKIILLAIFLFSLPACTPSNLVQLEQPDEHNKSSILIYRAHAYQYSAVNIVFGANGQDLIELEDKSYAQLDLNSGKYELFVRTKQADRPENYEVALKPGELVCLKTVAKPSYYAKTLTFGLATLMTSMFSLEKVSCPTPEFLSSYKRN